MPVEDSALGNFLNFEVDFFAKIFLILFLVFYAVFAFILYRQIHLMCRTLPTAISPLLKFVAIIHIGVALALLLAVLGAF